MAIFWIGGIPQPYRVETPRFQKGVERVRRTISPKNVAGGADIKEGRSIERERVRHYEGEPPPQRRPVILSEELMTQRIYTLGPDDTLQSARNLFMLHKIHHVPIVDAQNKLVGIVSDRDLLSAVLKEQRDGPLKLGEIMTRRVLATGPDTPIREVAGTMAREHIHAIPVVANAGTLIGLITAGDILGCLVNRAPLDLWI